MTKRFTVFFPALVLLILFASPSMAQIGGRYTYSFLSLTNSARVAALGGNSLTVKDNDITLSQANPSLITPEMNNTLALGYTHYFTGNNFGSVMYGHTFGKAGTFTGSLQFMDYGKFTGADETGQVTGEFSASEFAVSIGWGRALSPNFSIGANGKLIYSSLDMYNSFGIAVDVAGSYFTKNELFIASLLARNIGSQIVPYVAGSYEPLPFELQAALSQKFKHIPFRIQLLLTHLTQWNLSYTDPTNPENQKDPYTGEVQEKSGFSEFADNLMRHVVFGGEVTIAKVFAIRLGYNYERRQELKLSGKAGLSGFTYGFGLRVKMFSINYAYASYQAGGINPNYITLTANLGAFSKKQ